MNKLPRDIILIISKMHPLLIPPFTNDTLRRAVKDYLAGGDRKKIIVEKYGEISNWDVSKVTNTRMLHLFKKIRAVVADQRAIIIGMTGSTKKSRRSFLDERRR